MTSSDRRLDREVSSYQLRAYLEHKQWFEDGKIRNVATTWHRQDNEDAEVVLPFSYVKDYRQRIRDALASIASFEGRAVHEVLNEVKRLFANVITIRVVHDDTNDGTIPINDGVLLIAKAKDLLSAAARSLYAKRKQFTRGAPKEAKEYLETLLLGQTEIGSYVVNVIAPVQMVGDGSNNVTTIPLAQAITSNLVAGLSALEKATATYEEKGDLGAFDEAVLAGASSNMCDALLGFSGEKHNRNFEITVTAAPSPLFETEPAKFMFNGRYVEALEKATGYYKGDYILPERRLTGYITKLSRPKDETSGTITIDSTVGDVERKVQVELMGDDYHQAVVAHDNSKMVRVEGDVHIKSKSAQLLNPKNFGVIEIEDLL
ncbi:MULTISPECIES: hypothetical protein [Burkholderia]|uniref:Uncharacterized protein n=1 Tax=Burkholderia pyrrocinia TaxID=60550 RepID=A0A318IJQ6_BURPY|nr:MULTISPECIES: hypothetical protein [Burkholderia]PXX28032.1 hypothetical protein NA66_10193 [Burkholderia pyrrocinia]SFW84935.1 hypothetical protein SAMN03159384_06001 [Burkholderia sp. NFACC33-1]SFY45446.1 hypothetical protein SAMN03159408_06208 [Burkholderia sp. NFPP32]